MNLCLAGNITQEVLDVIINRDASEKSFILQSFIDYMSAKDNNYFMSKVYPNIDLFILDSGAFSMLYGSKKVNLDSYIEKYIGFVKKYKIVNYVELDLYNVIGVEKTEAIRKKLTKEIGYPPIPVWHKSTGVDYYKKLVKEYRYIAIGGIAIKGGSFPVNVFRKLLKIAKKESCRVHGLGYTSIKNLPKLDFYSVDSTSWLSPVRYGGVIDFFNGRTMKKIKQPKGTKMTKKVRVHQFKEWMKFSNYMHKIK